MFLCLAILHGIRCGMIIHRYAYTLNNDKLNVFGFYALTYIKVFLVNQNFHRLVCCSIKSKNHVWNFLVVLLIFLRLRKRTQNRAARMKSEWNNEKHNFVMVQTLRISVALLFLWPMKQFFKWKSKLEYFSSIWFSTVIILI